MLRELDVYVRQAVAKDAPIISDIEQESFGSSWGKNNFMNFLTGTNENCSIWVADYKGKPVGFRVQEKKRGFLHVTGLAVRPIYRRMGVGTSLIENAFTQLSYSELPKIYTEVRETDNIAIKFFATQGFIVKRPFLREFYEDTNEDAVPMVYRLAGLSEKDDWTEWKNIEFEYWGGQ